MVLPGGREDILIDSDNESDSDMSDDELNNAMLISDKAEEDMGGFGDS